MSYRPRHFRRWILALVIPHTVMGVLFLVSYLGMLVMVWSWSDFRPATFVVTEHKEISSRHGRSTHAFLRGTINDHAEDYRPPGLQSLPELRQTFSIGTRLDVLHNPDASRTFVQGQTLRVLPPDGLAGSLRFVLVYTAIFVIPWFVFAYLLYRHSPLLFRRIDLTTAHQLDEH